MKKYLAAVLLLLVTTTPFAAAQLTEAVIADVPFAFLIGTKSFPAGTYAFRPNDNLNEITVQSTKGKDSGVAAVITQLDPKSANEAAVVFDVAGANHYLSEVYIPGIDGFLVHGAPGKHTHLSVKGKKQASDNL